MVYYIEGLLIMPERFKVQYLHIWKGTQINLHEIMYKFVKILQLLITLYSSMPINYYMQFNTC